MQSKLRLLGIWLTFVAFAAAAQPVESTDRSTEAAVEPLEQILVTGEQPGPGLWKVRKGDHVLWVLGTLRPLPRKMTWRSHEVENVIANSQEVLATPNIKPGIGFFRSITLLPALLKARKNPDGAELHDILPPDLYLRWSTLKAKYLGNDRAIEEWRPMFAAQKLYTKAIEQSDLSTEDIVWPIVSELAKKHRVPINNSRVGIAVDDPKGAIKDFKGTPRDLDIACMRATLERLEVDVGSMKARANAWSVGDVNQLRKLPIVDQYRACLAAFTSTPKIEEITKRAMNDVINDWLTRAEIALDKNASTFAVLPAAELFAEDGRIARLREAGYEVEEP